MDPSLYGNMDNQVKLDLFSNYVNTSLVLLYNLTKFLGTETKCPNGTNSETGFTPNCKGMSITVYANTYSMKI